MDVEIYTLTFSYISLVPLLHFVPCHPPLLTLFRFNGGWVFYLENPNDSRLLSISTTGCPLEDNLTSWNTWCLATVE